MLDSIKQFVPNIHKEGTFFIVLFILVTLVLFNISEVLGWVGVILTLWCVFFFRDPQRVTPVDDDLVISPADGIVQTIKDDSPPKELGLKSGKMKRVSIFLNVFDVHVNRVPITGTVKKLSYHPGKFFNASLDKASKHNERQSILMTTKDGKEIAVVQIAGLIARRIVCNLEEGQEMSSGQRFGIIRFGSRVDVYLPKGIEPQVIEGQRVLGGETIIASLTGKLPKREGRVS